jgi:hypothetical protein
MADMNDAPEPRSLVRDFLATREVRCPACRHNLRGVKGHRCPECGFELHLTLRAPRFGSGVWLAGVFGLALTLILQITLIVSLMPPVVELIHEPQRTAMVRMGVVSASDLPHWTALLLTTATACLVAALLAVLITTRHSFARLPLALRLLLGLAAGISSLLLLLAVAIALHL